MKLILFLVAISLCNVIVDANCPDDDEATTATHDIFYNSTSVSALPGIIIVPLNLLFTLQLSLSHCSRLYGMAWSWSY